MSLPHDERAILTSKAILPREVYSEQNDLLEEEVSMLCTPSNRIKIGFRLETVPMLMVLLAWTRAQNKFFLRDVKSWQTGATKITLSLGICI